MEFVTKEGEKIFFHKGDLPGNIKFKEVIAVDTEMTGLNLMRDTVCVVQISQGDGTAHVIQLNRKNYKCPNLKKILTDKSILKIFHYARIDMAMIKKTLNIDVAPVYCTKIASRLVRTYTSYHGYKAICDELLNIDISKKQTQTDWAKELTEKQIEYAASDVLYLHEVYETLEKMLKRENRKHIAENCFKFLTTRVELDLNGWENEDIFIHTVGK